MTQALPALADPLEFSFGVIAQPRASTGDGNEALQTAIAETDADNLAFVSVQGIKPASTACTDKVYLRQKSLLDDARNGVIVSLAASDWARCPPESGKSSAVGRLGRLRDLFFFDDFSLGASRIPVTRQSTIAKFRGFPENARWHIGDIMFATLNLPSNNNNYVVDAGRNSEFEDRLVANRDWLNRVFTYAQREKAAGIVLFSDSNPLAPPRQSGTSRDGFAETRKLLSGLAGKYSGKILVVHGLAAASPSASAIAWQGNVAFLSVPAGWVKVNVSSRQGQLFSLAPHTAQGSEGNR
ncbi:hypothetical protein AYR66_21765 [Noviherbaspirillum denitrificans]|uniref:Uncharacterized protein n=2 Tax=Noviherbaspirillum denitrificans TaxID=1968433 RepID=A0A254TK96_9BURK|nr:hypothetical protein AYR66_21765 [Noviherbaspirillum denitrificans]